MNFKKIYISLFLLFPLFTSLSACSIYKSEGRKQFETGATNSRLTSLSASSCYKQNSLTTWLQSEFPIESYELIYSDNELEIWKSSNADGKVEISLIEIEENESTVCTYEFQNESSWLSYKQTFLTEVYSNLKNENEGASVVEK